MIPRFSPRRNGPGAKSPRPRSRRQGQCSLFSLGLLLGQYPHLDLDDPAVLHPGNDDIQALGLEVVPLLGDPAHLLHDPAGDGGRVAGALHLEQVVQVIQVGGTCNEIAAVWLLAEGLDVLSCGDALGAAVLVHDNGHVGLVLLQNAQQLGYLGVARGVEHGGL